MSVEALIRKKDRESKENIADLDREQREKQSKRGAWIQGGSAAAGLIGKIISAVNDSTWYKKFGYEKYVSQLPHFVNKSLPIKGTMTETAEFSMNGPATFSKARGGKTISTAVVFPYFPHIGRVSQESLLYDSGEDSKLGSSADYPINAAMMRTLTEMGKVNSRTVPVDPSVAAFYFLVVTDIYSRLARLGLCIKIAEHFDNANSYVPVDLLKAASGMTEAQIRSFRNNLADWRVVFEEYVSRVTTLLPLPADLSFVSRRLWLAIAIMKTSDSSLAPYMLFRQEYYGMLSADGTEVIYTDNNSDFYNNSSTARSLLENTINSVILNEYEATFISNMRAAVPESKFLKLGNLDSFKIEFTQLNDELRLIFQNIETLPEGANPKITNTRFGDKKATVVWHDDNGTVYQSSYFEVDTESLRFMPIMNHAINSYKDITADDVLVSTRLKNVYSAINSGIFLTTCNTEIILSMQVIGRWDWNDGNGPIDDTHTYYTYYSGTYDAIAQADFHSIDGCPDMISTNTSIVNMQATVELFHNYEVDKLIPVSPQDLTRIAYMCLQSLYHLDSAQFTKFGR